MFDDLLAGNARYAESFDLADMPGQAAQRVGIVCCMDARLDPLAIFDLKVGDAKILRTPGGRLTPDTRIGLIIGSHVLGIDRIVMLAHTKCAMASGDDASVVEKIRRADGTDLAGMRIGSTPDQIAGLRYDVNSLRSDPLVAADVCGMVYDVTTGRVELDD
ncbi:carbonic anhydrase [Cutibacterium sp. WCA-380-WT-3A]|uniref:carbonic anhydrase n=1 Tax=Cutibacterium porci TaxID=2605781 RepID=A0A7K0J6P1_9ACTN|nr:carbonic anhydrase [Cutibacterium porci]MSS45609.1 carbonic anhydrase [Cutibacterium porci]